MSAPSRTPEFLGSRKGRAQKAATWARQQARKHGSIDERVSSAVYERLFGESCTYCGTSPAEGADHAIPLGRGGANAEANLVPACRTCNRAKLFHTPEEWRAGTVVRVREYHRAPPDSTCRHGHVRRDHGHVRRDGHWTCDSCRRLRGIRPSMTSAAKRTSQSGREPSPAVPSTGSVARP